MAIPLEIFQTQSSRKTWIYPEEAIASFIKQKFKRYDKLVENAESSNTSFPIEVCQTLETNCYGKIRFHPSTLGYRKPAQYVRLADTPDAFKAALELMTKYWHLTVPKEPGLVISVLGGGKLSCLSDSQTKEIFNRGLIKAIKATHGWLMSNGLNSGVSKAVGSAVEEGRSSQWNEIEETDRSLHCIGVVPWKEIRNRQSLIVHEDSHGLPTVDYNVDPCVRLDEPVSLNPNHSHFLMVDDGTQSQDTDTGSAPLFKSELENLIAMPKEKGGLGVPVLCLLVEGGLRSLTQLLQSVEQGLPAVVLQNSGHAADLIVEAFRKTSFLFNTLETMDQYEQEDQLWLVLQGIINKFAEEHSYSCSEKEDLANIMVRLSTTTYRDQISMFKLNGEAMTLDEVLLFRVLESVKDQNPWKQLKLAQKWGRPDVAQRIMNDPQFSFYEDRASQEKLRKVKKRFTQCLMDNQHDFVQLFLDYGFPVQDYLKADTLCNLYLQTLTDAPFVWVKLLSLNKNSTPPTIEIIDKRMRKMSSKMVTLSSINKLFRSIGRQFKHSEYHDDNKEGFSHPYQELFYWAIVLNRQELAELFWHKCEEPLIMAIIGTVLCSWLAQMSKGSRKAAHQRIYLSLKDRLECLAVKLVNQAFEKNKKKAMLLIHRKSQFWGNLDSMALAALAKDQNMEAWLYCYQLADVSLHADICFCSMVDQLQVKSTETLLVSTRRSHKSGASLPHLALLRTAVAQVRQIWGDNDEPNQKHSPQQSCSYAISGSALPPDYGHGAPTGGILMRSLPSEIQEIEHKTLMDHQRRMTLHLWAKRIFIFYYSPAVKFITHTVWYIIYLLLYAFVVLHALEPPDAYGTASHMQWTEWLLYFWQLTFIMEELRIILWYPGDRFRDKLHGWWHFNSLATWNHFDLLTLASSIVIFILRWIPQLFPLVRLLLVLNLTAYIMRIFKMYFINDYLGPKVVMIKRMSKDLLMFFLVLVVFLASYSLSYRALQYGKKKFVFEELGYSFTYGLWEIFGYFAHTHIFQGKLIGDDHCNSTLLNISSGSFQYTINDCDLRAVAVQILLAAYLFFVNILLVNMLIATFAHIFEEIQANSELVWKFEMYFLLEEFRSKPLLPPPFIILEHIFLIVRLAMKWKNYKVHAKTSSTKTDEETILGEKLNQEALHFLGVFERVCQADFLEREFRNTNVHCSCTCLCHGCTMVQRDQHGSLENSADNFSAGTLFMSKKRSAQMAYSPKCSGQNTISPSAIKRKRFAAMKK